MHAFSGNHVELPSVDLDVHSTKGKMHVLVEQMFMRLIDNQSMVLVLVYTTLTDEATGRPKQGE